METSENNHAGLIQAVKDACGDPAEGRIFALMGPNGAGKTRYLKLIANALRADHKHCLEIRANRSFPAQAKRPPPSPANQIKKDENNNIIWEDFYSGPFHMDFDEGLTFMIDSLAKKDLSNKNMYLDQHWKSLNCGEDEPKPIPPEPLIPLFQQQISQILGYKCTIGLTSNQPGIDIQFKNLNVTFGLNGLSDGEKQILIVSTLLFTTEKPSFFVVVDEPELHLNDARAVQLWDQVEKHFPQGVFVYATHSVVFATRSSVSKLYLIKNGNEPETIATSQPLRGSDVATVVGARVQIARSSASPIFCEDNMSKLILEDLFKGQNVEFVVLRNCINVINACRGDDAWVSVVSKGTKFCGVIDRDTRSDEEVAFLAQKNIFCLPFYESESLLIFQELCFKYLINQSGHSISPADYVAALKEAALIAFPKTLDRIRKKIQSESNVVIDFELNDTRLEKLNIKAPEKIEEAFKSRYEALIKCISDGDVEKILQTVNGKGLYSAFVAKIKEKAGAVIVNSATHRYLDLRKMAGFDACINSIPCLANFKNIIVSHLASE